MKILNRFIAFILFTFISIFFQNCFNNIDNNNKGEILIKNESITINSTLVLFSLHNRKEVTLREVCNNESKLVFRYFAENCEQCISSWIKLLKEKYNDDFKFEVILLNNSYLKTYTNDSININEFYIKSLKIPIDENRNPYFFYYNPNLKSRNCRNIYICNNNDLKSTSDILEIY